LVVNAFIADGEGFIKLIFKGFCFEQALENACQMFISCCC